MAHHGLIRCERTVGMVELHAEKETVALKSEFERTEVCLRLLLLRRLGLCILLLFDHCLIPGLLEGKLASNQRLPPFSGRMYRDCVAELKSEASHWPAQSLFGKKRPTCSLRKKLKGVGEPTSLGLDMAAKMAKVFKMFLVIVVLHHIVPKVTCHGMFPW